MQFAANEKVLCYHGPLLYPAKIIKVDNKKKDEDLTGHPGPHYFVHYVGWKIAWDEWVSESRLLKATEESQALKKELENVWKEEEKRLTDPPGRNPPPQGRKKESRTTKRAREAEVDEDAPKPPEMRLAFPEILKLALVDDWEQVTKNSRLLPLPRTPTVVAILEEFRVHALKAHETVSALLLEEVVADIKTYFDAALAHGLLYKFERPHHTQAQRKLYEERVGAGKDPATGRDAAAKEVPEPGPSSKKRRASPSSARGEPWHVVEPSSMYGAEHLLRLLIDMPRMVSLTQMDQEAVTTLRGFLEELLEYLAEKKDRLFPADYEPASPAYQRLSMI